MEARDRHGEVIQNILAVPVHMECRFKWRYKNEKKLSQNQFEPGMKKEEKNQFFII